MTDSIIIILSNEMIDLFLNLIYFSQFGDLRILFLLK